MIESLSLRQAVNKTLTNEQIDYLVERQEKLTEAKNIKAEEKIARNQAYAKEFVEKQKAKKKLNG